MMWKHGGCYNELDIHKLDSTMRYAFIFVSTLLAGCSVKPFTGNPSFPAPSLKEGPNGYYWTNASAFGGVPEGLQDKGNSLCNANRSTSADDLIAIGYHPSAEDISGEPLPGGGFICLEKSNLRD